MYLVIKTEGNDSNLIILYNIFLEK